MGNQPLEDWEYPEPEDEDDEMAMIACPVCRRQVPEDVDYCPYCDTHIDSVVPSIFRGRPIWFILLAMAGVLAVLLVLLPF